MVKHLLTLFATLLILCIGTSRSQPQNSEYTQEWTKINELIDKELPRSALEQTQSLLKKAIAEGNDAQTIKCLMYIAALSSRFEEDDLANSIALFEKYVSTLRQPSRQILYSLLGDLYWRYYQQNRYKILATPFSGSKPTDIALWSVRDFAEHIKSLYLKSLKDPDLLFNVSIERYAPIINSELTAKDYSPTLYDLLADRAIQFFTSQESWLTSFEGPFPVITSDSFLPAEEFLEQHPPVTIDTSSTVFQVLDIFKSLLSLHKMDKNPYAYVYFDMKRLQYAREHYYLEDKDTLYLHALTTLLKKYTAHPVSADIAFELASYYEMLGNRYNRNSSDSYRWYKKRAFQLANKYGNAFPDRISAKNCIALAKRITLPSLSLQFEQVYYPGNPVLFGIQYRNLNGLTIEVYKIDNPFELSEGRDEIFERIEILKAKKPVKIIHVELIDPGDYQTHFTEYYLQGLPTGRYAILSSSNTDSDADNQLVNVSKFHVSHMAYTLRTEQGKTVIFLADRNEGNPVKNGKVLVYKSIYDYNSHRYNRVFVKAIQADDHGMIILSENDPELPGRIDVNFVDGRDSLIVYHPVYLNSRDYRVNKASSRLHLFTDRAIYRPGQTVFFKGLLVTTSAESTNIAPNATVDLELQDVNGRTVASQSFTTNAYGTFHGSFILPEGGLTGYWRLYSRHGSQPVIVEAYKRPSFKIEIDPQNRGYTLNDTVRVSGIAKTYTGIPLHAAGIRYTVERMPVVRMPYYSDVLPNAGGGAPVTISSGTAKTDEQGHFSFSFVALARTVKKDILYRFRVNITITDQAGEIQEKHIIYTIGNKSLILDMQTAGAVSLDQPLDLMISGYNTDGQPVATEGQLKIIRIKQPQTPLKNRLWQKPDLHILDSASFKKLFPDLAYRMEDDPSCYPELEAVYEDTVRLDKGRMNVTVSMKNWKEGMYKIVFTTRDRKGNRVDIKRFVKCYALKSKKPPENAMLDIITGKDTLIPGETAVFHLMNTSTTAQIIYELELKGKIIARQHLTSSNGRVTVSLPIKPDFTGNVFVHFTMIKGGRIYTEIYKINVPYHHKKLNISVVEAKKEILPSKEEVWRFRVVDHAGKPVNAEAVAVMYDASLDAIKPHQWQLNIWKPRQWTECGSWLRTRAFDRSTSFPVKSSRQDIPPIIPIKYPSIEWPPFFTVYRGFDVVYKAHVMMESAVEEEDALDEKNGERASAGEKDKIIPDIREDLKETAFFYPSLQTTDEGILEITFKAPESLSEWKLMLLAHTTDLSYGALTYLTATKKPLMVKPHLPRFFRENDSLFISTRLTNNSDSLFTGIAHLTMATTRQGIPQPLVDNPEQLFTLLPGQTATFSWNCYIPRGVDLVDVTIQAETDRLSDGERHIIPVLPARILVTESYPVTTTKGDEGFVKIPQLAGKTSSTLEPYMLTLEYTANPVWYAIQALPYMMEYPYECSEQLFSRLYANCLAQQIIKENPQLKTVIEKWKVSGKPMISELEKNPELKALIIEETPWLRDAQNETEQRKRLALLFDYNQMQQEIYTALVKLMEMQSPDGGWPWFDGGRSNRFITQHILTGFAKLKNLGYDIHHLLNGYENSIERAIIFLDNAIAEDYEKLMQAKGLTSNYTPSYIQLHYLYMRNQFETPPVDDQANQAMAYFQKQLKHTWKNLNIYGQGLAVLALYRSGDYTTAKMIIQSLKEKALTSSLGAYWKNYRGGYYWYESPVETHALLIEAFHVISEDVAFVENLKSWLLNHKRTHAWETTKATTEAIYALLSTGKSWLEETSLPTITASGVQIFPSTSITPEAGSGYIKKTWLKEEITPSLSSFTIHHAGKQPGWGAVHFQYFEELDHIPAHASEITVERMFLREKIDGNTSVLEPLADGQPIGKGDIIRVRIIVTSSRDLEFVHMKDSRPACFEPPNTISGYRWQGGLGYYQSVQDASTNFFIDNLPRGKHMFEYRLRVEHAGRFSSGILTAQSMYAPEFNAHTGGVVIKVTP